MLTIVEQDGAADGGGGTHEDQQVVDILFGVLDLLFVNLANRLRHGLPSRRASDLHIPNWFDLGCADDQSRIMYST